MIYGSFYIPVSRQCFRLEVFWDTTNGNKSVPIIFTDQLEEKGFVRVHRSYLVNLSLVTSLQSKGRQYHVFLKGVTEAIPVARSRVKDFRANLGPAN